MRLRKTVGNEEKNKHLLGVVQDIFREVSQREGVVLSRGAGRAG